MERQIDKKIERTQRRSTRTVDEQIDGGQADRQRNKTQRMTRNGMMAMNTLYIGECLLSIAVLY